MKIEYRIMGCRDRLPMVTHLSATLGIPQRNVYIDQKMSGDPLATQQKALSIPFVDDITHIVLLQDDCLVGKLFKDNIEALINVSLESIFSLFVPNPNKHLYKSIDSVILPTGGAVCGLANIIPVQYVKPYLEWWSELSKSVSYKADDATLAVFAKTHNIRVLTTIPSIVEHRCNDGTHSSALNHTHGSFVSLKTDIDADVRNFAFRTDITLGEYNGNYLQKYI